MNYRNGARSFVPILFICSFFLPLYAVFSVAPSSAAMDTPHTSIVNCSTCHSTANSAWWTDQGASGGLCGQCHNPSSGFDDAVAHNLSARFGSASIQCSTCHDPHYQRQLRTWKPASYLLTGTVSSVDTSTGAWIESSTPLTSGAYTGMLLVPNTAYVQYNYRITGNTATRINIDTTINSLNLTYVQPGKTFAISYGKLVRQAIGSKTVKFFGKTGPNSFADNDAVIDGVCQVCHARTSSFTNTGILEGIGHPTGKADTDCTICHSHSASSGGFRADCTSCHGYPPTANTPGGPSGLAYNEGGTGSTTSGAHQKHAVTLSYACDTCHTGGMPVSAIYDKKIQIGFNLFGFQSGTYDGRASFANGYSYSPGNAGTTITQNGAMTCTAIYCHSNGTSVSTGTVPANTSANWGSGTLVCSSCHGYPPGYANGSPKANSHAMHNSSAYQYNCSNCHYSTTTTGTTITGPSNHVNQAYDLAPGTGRSFSYAYASSGGTCSTVSCHSNTGTTWGKSACLDCHSVSINGRAAITPQFGANSHHFQGGAVTGALCYQCHWEANQDGSINSAYHGGLASPGAPVNLVIYGAGARPTSYALGTTAIQYTANGQRTEIAKITTHCLGCHNETNKNITPFGDGKKPTQYSWDGYSIDAKYSSTSTTPWGKYSGGNVTPKNTQTKAYSAHGNAVNNQGGWNTSETWPNTRGGATGGAANIGCFDCHNSHGSNAGDAIHPTTMYASATTTGGILKNTVANKGGYTMDYTPASGGSSANHNVYNPGAALCFDCHMTQNSGTTPWGYQGTFGATQPIMSYWESPYWGAGPFGPQFRYPFKSSTGNKGGHFGASSALTPGDGTSAISGLCTPCHDPHGVSPTIPISNQLYAVPLLKGTFMTSPYKEDVAPAIITIAGDSRGGVSYSNASYPSYHIDENTFANWNWAETTRISENVNQFGGLCLQCHPQSILNPNAGSSNYPWQSMNRVHNAVQGWGGQGGNAGNAKHSYTCSKCHTVHNSTLPRLMVTNCLDYTHRNGMASGGPAPDAAVTRNGSHSVPNCGGGSGSGQGQFPAGGHGTQNSSGFGWGSGAPVSACHGSPTANTGGFPNNQQWNTKTPWPGGAPITPAVVSISPNNIAQGASQATVTIQGTGFVSGAIVSLNDANITVGSASVASSTVLTVPVTVGASAALGLHNVTVTNPGGAAGTGTGLFTVTVNVAPTVTSASPGSLPQGHAQTTVTIRGTGFQSSAAVSFNDANITTGGVTFVNSTTLTVPVTVAQGATVGPRNVTVDNLGAGTPAGTGVNLFTVTAGPNPTSASPNSLPQGSPQAIVIINGSNFQSGATVSASICSSCGNDANIIFGTPTFVNSTQLSVPVTVTQSASSGAHNLTVTNPDGGSITGTNLFTVTQGPNISSLSPNIRYQGSPQVTVTIGGSGFQNGATVSFNDAGITNGPATWYTSGCLYSTCLSVPVTVTTSATLGAHNVTVTNPDLSSYTGTGVFTVNANMTPTVTSVSPNSRSQGSSQVQLTITGTNFQSGATVSFDDANIQENSIVGFVNSTTLQVAVTVLGSTTVGAHNVTVTNPDGTTGTGIGVFTVTPGLTVTSASPNSMHGNGPTTVTVTGTGFVSGATIQFNYNDSGGGLCWGLTLGTVTYVSSTTLQVPVTANSYTCGGRYNVVVTNPDGGQATGTRIFTFIPSPTVSSVSPNTRGAGTPQVTVTITGTYFQSGATVSFSPGTGITLGAVTFVDSTTLTVPVTVTSSAATGSYNVTVTNPDSGTGTGSSVFTVNASTPPTITSMSPSSRAQGTPQAQVNLSGSNIQCPNGGTISFNDPGITATNISCFCYFGCGSPYTLVTVSSSATLGSHNVTITNPDGTTGTSNGVFTVTSNVPPTITAFSPNSRGWGSSQATVTITGTGFESGATVTFTYNGGIYCFGSGPTVGAATYVNSTTLTVPVTASTSSCTGNYNVAVNNPDGTSVTGTNMFTVTSPPTVTSASPSIIMQGAPTTTVTVTGTGFESGATVAISNASITVGAATFVNSSTLTVPVTVPSGVTSGRYNITVNNPDGVSGTGSSLLTVGILPTVTSASPSSKPVGSGTTTVTITGTNFQSGVTVAFQTCFIVCSNDSSITPGAVTFVNSTTLTVPVTVGSSATAGSRYVLVTNPDGGNGSAAVFTISATPTVYSSNPNSKLLGTPQTTITITGTGFVDGATVSFNDPGITTGPATWSQYCYYGCTTYLAVPVTVSFAATTGAHNVIVTNPDGGTGTGAGMFTVTPYPQVGWTSPDIMYRGNSGAITVGGSGFQGGATVVFDDPNITVGYVSFTDSGHLQVSITVGAGATLGAHTVTVTNPDGGAGTGSGVFTIPY